MINGVCYCSIGSLGKDLKEEGVQNVTVKRVTFKDTDNGLRIKAWARPSSGFVNGVLFQNAVMTNVENPIVIDQNYCPGSKNCPRQVCFQNVNSLWSLDEFLLSFLFKDA